MIGLDLITPDLRAPARDALAAARPDLSFTRPDPEAWGSIESNRSTMR